jgi:DNA polymerase-1
MSMLRFLDRMRSTPPPAEVGAPLPKASFAQPIERGRRLRALDLYCCAGGAARGLMLADLEVWGVDIKRQPNYCGDRFIQGDALEYLRTVYLSEFDFIWASPPCQAYTSLRHAPGEHRDADLVASTREALIRADLPYVIENVVGAPLIDPITLSGDLFELGTHPYPEGWRLERRRLFEASFPLTAPAPRRRDDRPVVGIYGGHFRDRRRAKGANHRPNSNIPSELGYKAMGIPFGSMTTAEISDAIPPAYSRYIAEAWLKHAVIPSPAREAPPLIVAKPIGPPKLAAGSRARAKASIITLSAEPQLELELEPEPEPPAIFQVDGVEVVYCATRDKAEVLILEMIADAGGRPVALDIETTPVLPERQRLEALRLERAVVHAETLAAGRALKAAQKAQKAQAKGNGHDDVAVLEGALRALLRQEKHLSAQVEYAESAGLDPRRSHIRLAQLYGGGSRAAVIDIFRTGQSVLCALQGVDAVVHNLTFELACLGHVGVELGEKSHDTQQAAKLALGLHKSGLAAVVKHYLGEELDKDPQESDWSTPILSIDQRRYAARDVIWLWRLCPPLFRSIAPQVSAYKVQVAAAPAIARMNRAGVTLDLAKHAEALEAFADEDALACAAYRKACLELNPPRPDLAAKVPRSDGEVAAFLKSILTEEELRRWRRVDRPWELSTARPELRKAIHYPAVAPLIELSELDGLRLSFGETLRHFVSPVTGRLHPSYQLCGAPTGRSSCSRPNIQACPRNPEIRALFRAAAGYVFAAADYHCMEVRVAAPFFDDLQLAAVFERGEDPHKITAARVTGKPIEDIGDGEERNKAKSTNFGIIYGISAGGLIEQIWKQSRVMVGMTEAEGLLIAFEQLYPDLMAHRREYVRVCQVRGAIVIDANWREGRGRIVPFARLPADQTPKTCACNYPIQGLSADICMKAIADVDRRLREEGVDGRLVGWIHDELIVEVRERDAGQVRALLKDAMEKAFLEVFPKATLLNLVEVKTGENWAAVKEKR